MVFYKGAVTYRDFENMTLPEMMNLKANADKINQELIREQEKAARKR